VCRRHRGAGHPGPRRGPEPLPRRGACAINADDHELARDLAAEAGELLLELRATGGEPDLLRKAGDRRSHEFLTAALAARRPGDVVLSEEGADDPARLTADRVWIVDPLDGTREFGEPGRTDWAVHVALWQRTGHSGAGGSGGSGDLTAGAVALPAQGHVLSTTSTSSTSTSASTPSPSTSTSTSASTPSASASASTSAASTGEQQQCSIGAAIATPMFHRVQDGAAGSGAGGDAGADEVAGTRVGGKRVRIVVSRTRAPRLVRDISDLIDAELVPLGSAGAKVAAVVCGEADAYVHAGGFYEWDTAAPVAVARAAGYHASRIDGSPLAYNQANLKMPDILVCRPALAGALLQAIREVTNAS
jgi:3'(2'), 5'-bisphosphate nucleotidase